MSSTEKLSVGALIGVILRRKINRTIDVKWLVENETYAREIIGLCREQGQDDLNEYALHLEKLMFGETSATPFIAPKAKVVAEEPVKRDVTDWAHEPDLEVEESEDEALIDASKYIGGLR